MANFGETLRQARAHKGVTLKEAEQATRINRSHLAAMEDENFRALPPLIYQRGIVRNYALYLDLDPTRILALFEDARGEDSGASTQTTVEAVPPVNMPTHWAPNFAIIAFSVVLSAIVFAWTYSAFVQPSGEAGEATEIVATVTPYASDIVMPTDPPATATATAAPSPTPEPTATSAPVDRIDTGRDLETPVTDQGTDSSGSDNQLQNAIQSQLPDGESQVEESLQEAEGDTQTESNVNVTSIKVEGIETITLSIVADGVEVWQGTLQPGEETPFIDGTTFEVATSSGVNTWFTNACGAGFTMSEEPGAVSYWLQADEDSCDPVGD